MVSTCLWNTPSRCPGTRVATHPRGLISALAVLVDHLFENDQKYLARSLDERGQAEKNVCGGAARGYDVCPRAEGRQLAIGADKREADPRLHLELRARLVRHAGESAAGPRLQVELADESLRQKVGGGASVEQRREVALLLERYLRYAAYSNSGLKPPTAEASSCWMRRRKRAMPSPHSRPGTGIQ